MKPFVCLVLAAFSMSVFAQRIDLDQNNSNKSQVEEPGYQHWTTGRTTTDISKDFTTDDGGKITITMGVGGIKNRCLAGNWWKQGCQQYSKLVCDGFIVYGYDNNGNAPQLTSDEARLYMKVSKLKPGSHSLLVYMNQTDGMETMAPIDIYINNVLSAENVQMTNRATTISTSAQVYLTFEAEDGKDVEFLFVSKPDGQTWGTSGIFVNALVFDRPNPLTQCADPEPADRDFHADCDDGSAHLKWTMAGKAVKNHVYVGTSADNLVEVATTTKGAYNYMGVSNLETYYWRIDEEDAEGNVYEGELWTFRPRHLAFPGAEGYGRFATGGRGGSVYHVTTLEDNGDDANPVPGSFRYGVKKVAGPRTIVFDVAGTIYLKARLTCSDPYVTIAGQTAPGKGILFRGAPIGISSENIMRFIRMRRGFHNDEKADMDRGLDGLGINGDHAIMDHCSMAWTIDEAHSSRNSKNITFQYNLISEALNDAHHPNYGSGTKHGYAATIGGETSSYHHNLLAHNEGRNWSLSGGLDGGGAYAGKCDMFNNVCYNWGGRATDGGTHEGQFVNNYYIMGPATTQKFLLKAELEGTGSGSQAYYVKGNIREEKNGTLTEDKLNETYKYETSGGQKVDWTVFVDKPFFESYATIDNAQLAYKKVLSDCGVNYIGLDAHDARVLNDVLNRKTTYKGSSTGKAGLIDREWDAEGYKADEFPEESRPEDFDTDRDGMPDWWENIVGTNPAEADNNLDADGDGYTALEDYLNFLAEPHYVVGKDAHVIFSYDALFRGFNLLPELRANSKELEVIFYELEVNEPAYVEVRAKEGTLPGIYKIVFKADDGDGVGLLMRTVQIAVTAEGGSGIQEIAADADLSGKDFSLYSINGQLLVPNFQQTGALPSGAYILKQKNGGKTLKFIKK